MLFPFCGWYCSIVSICIFYFTIFQFPMVRQITKIRAGKPSLWQKYCKTAFSSIRMSPQAAGMPAVWGLIFILLPLHISKL